MRSVRSTRFSEADEVVLNYEGGYGREDQNVNEDLISGHLDGQKPV